MTRESSIPHILSLLRIILHVSFTSLLGVGILRYTLSGPHHPAALSCVLILAGVLAGLYCVGTVTEIRFSRGASTFDPRSLTRWWLTAVLVLWAGLIVSDEGFAWVSFPLFFLVLYAWSALPAALTITAMVALIGLSSAIHSSFNPGVVIGPVIGAVVAVTMSAVYRMLVDEAVRTRTALESLRAAQAKLALAQHHEGRLAERQRVAAEFHDTLAQSLMSIVLMSRTGSEHPADALRTIETTATESLSRVRGFLAGEEFTAGPLEAELKSACAAVESASEVLDAPMRAVFSTEGTPIPLSASLEHFFSRAGQSLLANALLHAEADDVRVSLHYWDSAVSLDVVDNGRGFLGSRYGYGLNSLHTRCEELGGALTVRTGAGGGTEVNVFVPVAGRARPAAARTPNPRPTVRTVRRRTVAPEHTAGRRP